MGKFRLSKSPNFAAKYLCVINIREELFDLRLPFVVRIWKWLDELVKNETEVVYHVVTY